MRRLAVPDTEEPPPSVGATQDVIDLLNRAEGLGLGEALVSEWRRRLLCERVSLPEVERAERALRAWLRGQSRVEPGEGADAE